MRNSRTTWSSPSRRHRSSASVAALTAAGRVITGSEKTSSARLSARKLNNAASAVMIRVPRMPVSMLRPFVPVRAIPWMNVRWVRKNRMTIGAVAAVAPAITHAQFVV